jgi:pimeloyl-ACP methyl ester carboxylesterase
MLDEPCQDLKDRPPFVLVHGGRHGGWCWQRVARILRRAGHEVHVLTMTGLGERSHLLRPDIGLDVHVCDLVAMMHFEDVNDAVVVGHSYGGMVVSGAMEGIADRVRRLVFLDAPMPHSGESFFAMIGPESAAMLTSMAIPEGDGWVLPPSDASMYGITDPDDLAWANARLTAQPLATLQQAVGTTERARIHPGMFIECTPSAMRPEMLTRPKERNAVDERFHYRVLDAVHDAMITAPAALCEVLLEAVDLP